MLHVSMTAYTTSPFPKIRKLKQPFHIDQEDAPVIEHVIIWCDRCTCFGTLCIVFCMHVVPRVASVVSLLPGLLMFLGSLE